MLIIFGGFDVFVQNDQWPLFFLILGSLVSLGGIIGLFLIKESDVRKSEENYWKTLIYGFRPSTIRKHPTLYLYLCAFALFGISTQVFFPYFLIYIQRYLGIDSYAIIMGIVLIISSVVSILVGRKVTAENKNKFLFPSMGVLAAGLMMLFFAKGTVFLIVAGTIMMSGNLIVTSVMNAKVRDYTPLDKVGHFQGIRMIFYVLIPMVVGPFIGAAVIQNSGEFYNDLGTIKPVPTPGIFLGAAIVVIFIAIPLYFAFRKEKRTSGESAV
ncbi:MAG TPA: MFS transporter, partial [Bacillota bacterium]|nr:MFS transporter [Bacillota bacterium]